MLQKDYCSVTKAAAFLVKLIRAGLGVFDENFDGNTPWATARRLCVVPRRIFEDALRRCNIDSTGLFVAGEICPGGPLFSASLGVNNCRCETSSQTVADLEYSHSPRSTGDHDGSEHGASRWSESRNDHMSEYDFAQSIEDSEDDTASGICEHFNEAATSASLSRSNSEVTEQGALQDVPSYQESTSSSRPPTMDFLSTSSQNGRVWPSTGSPYQQPYSQDHNSWNSTTPDLTPARLIHGIFHQLSPQITSDPFSASPEHQDTYSSALAWASGFQQPVEVMETMMDVTTDLSTEAVEQVRQISITDILNT